MLLFGLRSHSDKASVIMDQFVSKVENKNNYGVTEAVFIVAMCLCMCVIHMYM